MNKINEKVSKDFGIKLNRVNKKLEEFCKKEKIEIGNITMSDVEKFMVKYLITINRSAFYDSIRCLNTILNDNGVDIYIDSKDYVDKYVKIPDEKYFTFSEMKYLCDSLMNYQDKLIIYALFHGIYGKNYSDLLTISRDRVAEDFSYIDLQSGKRFICDDYMKRILKGSFKANIYYKYISSEDIRSNDHFELSPESEYAIKPMPTSKNDSGRKPMAASSLQRNFMKYEKAFKEETGDDILISGESLIVSGILWDMFLKEVEGKEWSVEEVGNYLKMNGWKKNKNEIYRKYFNRYHDTNRGE